MDIIKSYGMDSSWINIAHTAAFFANAKSYSFSPVNLKKIPCSLADLITNTVSSFSRNAERFYDKLIPLVYPMESDEKPIWSHKEIHKISLDYLTMRAIERYKFTSEKFDVIVIGPVSGGLSLMACELGAPYLPTQLTVHLFCPLPQIESVHDLLTIWLKKIRDFSIEDSETILHYDPIHDKEAVKNAIFMRIRFNKLPENYENFIKKHLKKGGRIIFIDCEGPQIQTEINENFWLQVGSFGEIDFTKIIDCNGYKFKKRPDAEGGSSPTFKDFIKEYCQKNDFELIYGTIYDPVNYSLLNAAMSRQKNDKLIIGSYTLFSPLSAKSNWATIWIPFVDKRSYNGTKYSLKILNKNFDRIIFGRDLGIGPDIIKKQGWINLLQDYGKEVDIMGMQKDKDYLSVSYYSEVSNFTEITYNMFKECKHRQINFETFIRSCEELKIV